MQQLSERQVLVAVRAAILTVWLVAPVHHKPVVVAVVAAAVRPTEELVDLVW